MDELMASDQLQAFDAVYRFCVGQDVGDRSMYESAFDPDAELDFRQPAERFGAEAPLMRGREAIMRSAFAATSGIVTTHAVSNLRFTPTELGGEVYALVAAHHVDPGPPQRHLLLMNHYRVAVRREQAWRITRLVIENAWSEGDPSVLFPGLRLSAP